MLWVTVAPLSSSLCRRDGLGRSSLAEATASHTLCAALRVVAIAIAIAISAACSAAQTRRLLWQRGGALQRTLRLVAAD